MSSSPRRRTAAALVCAAAVWVLPACGGQATSTDDATQTSIAPLPREGAVTATDNTTPTTAATTTSDDGIPAAARVRKPDTPATVDQGAKEISTIPTFAPDRTPVDAEYLTTLIAAGIDVKGVEDQLIGAAVAACKAKTDGRPDVTLPAVAGQLIAQGRTQLDPKRAADLLSAAATGAYCH